MWSSIYEFFVTHLNTSRLKGLNCNFAYYFYGRKTRYFNPGEKLSVLVNRLLKRTRGSKNNEKLDKENDTMDRSIICSVISIFRNTKPRMMERACHVQGKQLTKCEVQIVVGTEKRK